VGPVKAMRGIEPIIAVVILVAITLVIVVAVVGWVMGWWGAMGSAESLQIYPDSSIDAANKTLYLYLKNAGTTSAVICKVEVAGVCPCSGLNNPTLATGSETTLELTIPSDVTPSASYTVRVYIQYTSRQRLLSNSKGPVTYHALLNFSLYPLENRK